MYYSKCSCFICGVRFNIIRHRRTDEPLHTAWDAAGNRWRRRSVRNVDQDEPQRAYISPFGANGPRVAYGRQEQYVGFNVTVQGRISGSPCEAAGCDESEGDHACGGPACGLVLQQSEWNMFGTGQVGYNGWRISDEEMRVMTCVQAVIGIQDWEDWEPEDDDDEYETSSLLLTAVSESTPISYEVHQVTERHGVGGHISIDDVGKYDIDYGVPFHGPCYQVLKRVAKSTRLPRRINVLEGILELRNSYTLRQIQRVPRSWSIDFHNNNERWWNHIPGTEYLASNPNHIPVLDNIINSCINPDTPVLPEVYTDAPIPGTTRTQRDPFLILSPELLLLILSYLPYRDVTALRLSTRAYRTLPRTFFRTMIKERMPWIWEINELDVPYDQVDWFRLWYELDAADGGKGVGEDGRSFRLENNGIGGLGRRVNGLVNRRRVWQDARNLLEEIVALGDWETY